MSVYYGKFLGFNVYQEEEGMVLNAPCACDACRKVQLGELGVHHINCDYVPIKVLVAEKIGAISAIHSDKWRWVVANEELVSWIKNGKASDMEALQRFIEAGIQKLVM